MNKWEIVVIACYWAYMFFTDRLLPLFSEAKRDAQDFGVDDTGNTYTVVDGDGRSKEVALFDFPGARVGEPLFSNGIVEVKRLQPANPDRCGYCKTVTRNVDRCPNCGAPRE